MMMRRFIWLALATILWVGQAYSQEREEESSDSISNPLAIKFGTRIDYQRQYLDGDADKENCGFRGKYLFLDMGSDIGSKISFFYRQRLNEINHVNTFFDTVDFLTLTYKFNSRWDITAGKMPVFIGSWEYERNPMFAYNFSEWSNHFSCFKFGAYIGYKVTPNDRLIAQFSESPFNDKNDLYGYHLAWYGRHGFLNTIYTANLLERYPGHFMYFLCLGHQFNVGKFSLEFDCINRASGHHAFFFKDYSLVGELAFSPNNRWSIRAKGAYDANHTDDPTDSTLAPGTSITNLTGITEFFPLKDGNRNWRVYATCAYSFGTNNTPGAYYRDNQVYATIGTQFYIDVVDLARRIWNKAKK